jgi:hypothetical protein
MYFRPGAVDVTFLQTFPIPFWIIRLIIIPCFADRSVVAGFLFMHSAASFANEHSQIAQLA